jgi:hypothetical protein
MDAASIATERYSASGGSMGIPFATKDAHGSILRIFQRPRGKRNE